MSRIKHVFGAAAAAIALPVLALAQGAQRISVALANVGNYARVLANAQITVCQYNVIAPNVCTAPVTVYQNPALTIPYTPTGQLRADSNGNYSYWAAAGSYWEQTCATGALCQTRQITLSVAGGVSAFNGRVGGVSPQSGDYTAAQVTNAADKSSTNPQVFNGKLQAPDSILGAPKVDPRYFGAVGDGTTDDCTALVNASNAAAAANSSFYIPENKTFATSCTVPFLSNWWVGAFGGLKTITGGTSASVALVSTGTSVTLNHVGIYGPGTLNGNSLSPTIVWVEQGHHVNIAVANIIGLAVNGKGVYWGDDAGAGAGGNEGIVDHVGFGLSLGLGPGPAGSTCIYISGGNGTQGAFTDDNVSFNVLHNCSVGYQDHVGGNNYFSFNHAWDTAMTTCFDEYTNGGTMVDEYCDTPSAYGFHVRGLLTRILGGTAYLGTSGTDNTSTAIQFDQSAEPQAVVIGTRIYGNDSTHRWAADTNLGFSTALTTWCDLIEGNIVAIQEGAVTCLQGVKFQIQTGSLQIKFGTLSMSPTAITCGSACTFSNGTSTNIWVATLSANATSTFVSSNPGDRIYTVNICQPATGGPFTFAWPTNSVGGGTIGTTASKCSIQQFQWDGTTLKAVGAIQINE